MIAGARPEVLKPAAQSVTVESLFKRYSQDVSGDKGGVRWERIRLKSLPATFPLFRGPVAALDAVAVAKWRYARLLKVKASTVNRELNLISAVLNTAIKEWHTPGLPTNPIHAIKRPRNPPARTQRVSAAQRALIYAELEWDCVSVPRGAKQWVAWGFSLALETAMRRGEISALTWQHVHLDAQHVHLPKTKNGHPRDVPLSKAAVALLRMIPAGKPTDPVWPVQYGTAGTLFSRARTDAKLPGIRFHDARREATTEMSKRLANVLELSAVTGHRSLQLLKTYYAPDVGDLAAKLG